MALAGLALAVPLAPWLGLRERAMWALDAAAVTVALTDGIWVAMAAATAAALIVPGLLLLEAAAVPRHDVLRCPAYLPAASIVALAGVGVLANFAGPPLGVDDPFTPEPMLLALNAVLVALAMVAALRRPQAHVPAAALALAWPRVRDAWPLVLPAAAAVGAGALTVSGDRTIALATVAASVATLAVGFVQAGADIRPGPAWRCSARRWPASTPSRCRAPRCSAGISRASTRPSPSCSRAVTGRASTSRTRTARCSA